jgi:hypothetical protein
MECEIYIAFYDNKCIPLWKSALIKLLTLSNVTHVGLIFTFPFESITPLVLDGKPCVIIKEQTLERTGARLLYKKYMGTFNICIEDIKKLASKHKIWTWYQALFWFIIGRLFGLKVDHCGTLAANWLNTNLKYNFKFGSIPGKFMQEVKNDYHYDWR